MKKILIIEDDFAMAQGLADILEEMGHEIDLAVNGYEGLEKANEGQFDLIITDINMPLYDGIYFMENYNRGTKVVCLSTPKAGQAERMLDNGCTKVYAKTEFQTLFEECGL